MVESVSYDTVERFALLLGLSLFFGFAFEEYYSDSPQRPGGVRTFPLLALAGGSLFAIEPRYGAAFVAGLLVVGSWIYAYLRERLDAQTPVLESAFVVPACNLLAYVLGALTLTQPPWMSIAAAVAAVLLLTGRSRLHDWAARVPRAEIVTAAQFLTLVGVVLPLLWGRPAIPYTTITPFGVWLAVVAVSTISYASYLLQRFSPVRGGVLWSSLLGGLYSSTATTVVLARRARDEGMTPALQSGIVTSTAMMYLRILLVCTLFDVALARALAIPLLALAALSGLLAAPALRAAVTTPAVHDRAKFANPLQLSTAFVFALLFVAVSMLATVAQRHFGHAGIFALAGIVGVTDIDPFVLSLAQGGVAGVGVATAAAAILIAASSNDVLKAAYTLAFSRRRASAAPAAMLGGLAVAGLSAAFWFVR